MKYYEAISNAIVKIEENVNRPVRLMCDIKKKSVKIYVLVEGKWEFIDEILAFDNVSHWEVETFILGSIENVEKV